VFECSIGFLIPLIYGSQIQYIEKPPTPKILVDALGKVRPTFMVSVPLIIEKIFKNKIYPNLTKNIALRTAYKVPMIRKKLHKVAGKKLIETFGGRLHFFGIGGAKISAQVEAFLDEADFPYTIGYGLTETSPLLSGTVAQYRRLRSAGTMLHGLEYRINENKELVVKGPNIMMGYYKDEERTKEVLEDGWFNTGDLGVIDQDGYLFIEGRSKNVIVGPSGENIYPEQIESKLNDYEFVLESVVYLDSNRLQARVHLDYEKLDEKFNTDNVPDSQVEQKIQELLEEIRIDLNESVSSFSKIMKFIEQREPFVKTATKKIKRYLYTEN
ncbi:MAG: AMP-binding protein, partial [Campylobacterales bacterium]|nr:AMP-binding protein [Campylobacterales bacterium]